MYSTMTGLIDETDRQGRRRFGASSFDLVVIDEAHRSVYQKDKAILDWFDGILVAPDSSPAASALQASRPGH